MVLRSPSTCELILDQLKKDKCLSSVSASTGNGNLCNRIQNQEMRDGCIVEVVRRNPLEYDENVCEELKTQEPKDKCYKFISRSQEPGGDSSLCEKIQNTEDKDTCYQEAGIRDNDVTSCERIETSGYERDYCFTNVGIGTSDTSLCERAQNPEPKDTCYKTLAKKLGDATVCNNIVNQIEKDGCNYEVARDTDRMHLELCESLQDQEYKRQRRGSDRTRLQPLQNCCERCMDERLLHSNCCRHERSRHLQQHSRPINERQLPPPSQRPHGIFKGYDRGNNPRGINVYSFPTISP
jgi:hypothetical protein